ncbi:MAG: BMC domain-containing protein [Clostridiales bacterium]|nr:BMC domain-containing protein [Clostridiales bacterium]
MYKSIGLVEFGSIALGIIGADVMLKTAEVELITAGTVCPGKYTVMVGGGVAAVESSVRAGVKQNETSVIDEFIIPNVHPEVFPAIAGVNNISQIDSLGVIETFSVASLIIAADAAVKAGAVRLVEIRLAIGMGGKSFVTLTGDVAAVKSAVQAGSDVAAVSGMLANKVIIPSPHSRLKEVII